MHESTLKSLSCFDEVKELLLRGGMFAFSFNVLPFYPTFIIAFFFSFTLRSIHYDNENPYFSMRFKLGGKDHFMTHQAFDTLFGFGKEDYVQPKPNWLTSTFWKEIKAPQAPNFSVGHTKSSHIKSKAL